MPERAKTKQPVSPGVCKVEQHDVQSAEVALKAHAAVFQRELLEDILDMEKLKDSIDLTEAPEDAVCSLVIDLIQYCRRNGIDWEQDVIERAQIYLRGKLRNSVKVP